MSRNRLKSNILAGTLRVGVTYTVIWPSQDVSLHFTKEQLPASKGLQEAQDSGWTKHYP